jgi:hypothetical protein
VSLKVDVSEFWKDGFTLVRGAYTPEEIEQFRTDSLAQKGKHGGDLLSNPFMNRVMLDGKMADIARQILDREDLVYYGDTTIAIREGSPGWHKDNADRLDPNAPDWRSDYTQLRFGVYLQDHAKHSGGLNVRRGSHNVADLTTGEVVHMQSRIGDIGVWSMRITHSAAGTLLKWAPGRNRHPDPFELDGINPKQILPREKKRIAIFSAIGAEDEHHERYLTYLKTREYVIPRWLKTFYTQEQINGMKSLGVKVRDMRVEVEGDPNVGQNKKWEPIPY